jgi:hypothetical protein
LISSISGNQDRAFKSPSSPIGATMGTQAVHLADLRRRDGRVGMSLSAAHRAAFRREVPQEGRVFSIRDVGGLPAPKDADGRRALPFWSKLSRAKRVVDRVAAYQGFDVVEIDVDDWLESWIPELVPDGYLVGINWAGVRATGYDLAPAEVLRWFAEPS